jgi:Sec-independent protein translocase protein TatA
VLNLDPAKLLVILVAALVVLGPDRLPSAARQLGGAWRTLTHLREQVTEEVRRAIPDVDLPHIPRAGAVTNFLTDLTRPAASSPTSGAVPSGEEGGLVEEPRGTGARHSHTPLISVDDPSMN